MPKIVPHLWFDKEAVAAANLYASTFPNSRVKDVDVLPNTPTGPMDMVTFDVLGREIRAIGAGPEFKFNPSVSFHISCGAPDAVEAYWGKLKDGGMVLMELGTYPFAERFGWLQDRYGLSWQLDSSGEAGVRQKMTPFLMFVGGVCGKAEEAVRYWTSVFGDSKVNSITRYGKDEGPDQEGTVKSAFFTLFGEEFRAMDSAYDHQFGFNEAISFIVNCDSQAEIDHYWEKLSAVPEAEQCGWLKDRFGFSWQIVPTRLGEMMAGDDEDRIARVTNAFLQMKKFDLAELQKAYEGK